jgi:putative acetyltransferase
VQQHRDSRYVISKIIKDSIEIKRMFVKSENRGSGIAKLILNELEKWAIEKNFPNQFLEQE